MKRVIDVSETLYQTCIRLVSEGDPRPSESCIANSEPYESQGDCVSREALKESIRNAFKHNFNGYDALMVNEVYAFINNAPAVGPERQKAEWVDSPDGLPKCCCNLCGAKNVTIWRSFCPNCGAKMSAEAEDAALQSKIDYLVQNMNISAARALVIIRIITGEVHI